MVWLGLSSCDACWLSIWWDLRNRLSAFPSAVILVISRDCLGLPHIADAWVRPRQSEKLRCMLRAVSWGLCNLRRVTSAGQPCQKLLWDPHAVIQQGTSLQQRQKLVLRMMMLSQVSDGQTWRRPGPGKPPEGRADTGPAARPSQASVWPVASQPASRPLAAGLEQQEGSAAKGRPMPVSRHPSQASSAAEVTAPASADSARPLHQDVLAAAVADSSHRHLPTGPAAATRSHSLAASAATEAEVAGQHDAFAVHAALHEETASSPLSLGHLPVPAGAETAAVAPAQPAECFASLSDAAAETDAVPAESPSVSDPAGPAPLPDSHAHLPIWQTISSPAQPVHTQVTSPSTGTSSSPLEVIGAGPAEWAMGADDEYESPDIDVSSNPQEVAESVPAEGAMEADDEDESPDIGVSSSPLEAAEAIPAEGAMGAHDGSQREDGAEALSPLSSADTLQVVPLPANAAVRASPAAGNPTDQIAAAAAPVMDSGAGSLYIATHGLAQDPFWSGLDQSTSRDQSSGSHSADLASSSYLPSGASPSESGTQAGPQKGAMRKQRARLPRIRTHSPPGSSPTYHPSEQRPTARSGSGSSTDEHTGLENSPPRGVNSMPGVPHLTPVLLRRLGGLKKSDSGKSLTSNSSRGSSQSPSSSRRSPLGLLRQLAHSTIRRGFASHSTPNLAALGEACAADEPTQATWGRQQQLFEPHMEPVTEDAREGVTTPLGSLQDRSVWGDARLGNPSQSMQSRRGWGVNPPELSPYLRSPLGDAAGSFSQGFDVSSSSMMLSMGQQPVSTAADINENAWGSMWRATPWDAAMVGMASLKAGAGPSQGQGASGSAYRPAGHQGQGSSEGPQPMGSGGWMQGFGLGPPAQQQGHRSTHRVTISGGLQGQQQPTLLRQQVTTPPTPPPPPPCSHMTT